jgi:ABC-type oligopeptide transport system ATPase subunit
MRAWQGVAEAVQVWRGASAKEARVQAFQLLNSVGISSEQAEHFPKSLSGGQLQRVSVARALAPNPKVLIADEPTSSIDQSAQAQLLNLLRRLQQERALTIVFISHDLGLIRYLTSRVYVMQKGKIVESGDTLRVFDQPEHAYTRLLLASIPGRAEASVPPNWMSHSRRYSPVAA